MVFLLRTAKMADSINNTPRLVTIFGGSGFVGRHLVRAMAKRGWRVRVAVRRPDLAGYLQPLGQVGQIHGVQANLRYPQSIRAALEGADAVVNLVGILHESGRQSFHAVQAEGARAVAQATAAAGIRTLVHMSAIGAEKGSTALYADSKARGEEAVLQALPEAVIARASAIFGPEDRFLNLFASMASLFPVMPLIGGGATRFQPVFVGDVAEAIAGAVEGQAKAGTIYELGGPRVMSLRDILEYVLAETGRKRPLVTIPFALAEIKGAILGMLPNPMLTRDQVEMLKHDNVVSDAAVKDGRTLAGLGVSATAIESVAPEYLWRFRRAGQFSANQTA